MILVVGVEILLQYYLGWNMARWLRKGNAPDLWMSGQEQRLRSGPEFLKGWRDGGCCFFLDSEVGDAWGWSCGCLGCVGKKLRESEVYSLGPWIQRASLSGHPAR